MFLIFTCVSFLRVLVRAKRRSTPQRRGGAGAGSMRMKCELEWSVRELAAAVEIVHLRLLLSDLPAPHDFSAA